MPHLSDSRVTLVANGLPESPPAGPVRDFLLAAGASVTTIFHPLSPEDPGVHVVSRYRDGVHVQTHEIRLPSRPPLTYAFDPFAPARSGRAELWIGFNNLAAAQGLVRRRLGRARRVAYWAVDFVPDRFGPGAALSRVYDVVDRVVSKHVDLRVELTSAALEGRSRRLKLGADAAPAHVAPIGTWYDAAPKTPEDGWRARRVVFGGHLVPRQGVGTLLEAIALLPDVELDVTGKGPLQTELERRTAELGIGSRVRFHGYLHDHRDVERLVAGAAVAAAPYSTRMTSFTRFADPAKLRTYTGAGLPVVLTDVPPNAAELAREAGAEIVADDPQSVAAGISRILDSPEEWRRRRAAALGYAAQFDWNRIVADALARLDFVP